MCELNQTNWLVAVGFFERTLTENAPQLSADQEVNERHFLLAFIFTFRKYDNLFLNIVEFGTSRINRLFRVKVKVDYGRHGG